MDPGPCSTDGSLGAAMSIDRISLSNGAIDRTLQSNGTEDLRPTPKSRQSIANATDDAISLSDSARNADRLAKMMNANRSNRLEAVRQAIADGSYKVSGADIASKLIAFNTH
jgi:negative regulator of flagellin synthesis FlgM